MEQWEPALPLVQDLLLLLLLRLLLAVLVLHYCSCCWGLLLDDRGAATRSNRSFCDDDAEAASRVSYPWSVPGNEDRYRQRLGANICGAGGLLVLACPRVVACPVLCCVHRGGWGGGWGVRSDVDSPSSSPQWSIFTPPYKQGQPVVFFPCHRQKDTSINPSHHKRHV